MSHAGGINFLNFFLLVATELIDNGKGNRGPIEIDLHTIVFVSLHGTGVEEIVEDVVAIEAQSPFSIV